MNDKEVELRHLFVIEKEAWIDDEEVIISEKTPYHQFKLSVFTEVDYVEENKELLIDWFTHYHRFPLTAYVSAYADMYEQIDALLIEWGVSYEKVILASEKKPVYIIDLANSKQLTQVVSAFYWLPAQNEMMFLTDCKEAVVLTERNMHAKSNYTILGAEIQLTSKECSVIIVQPDGQGMDVVTTVHSLSSAEGVRASIPGHYAIRQWDDELLIQFE